MTALQGRKAESSVLTGRVPLLTATVEKMDIRRAYDISPNIKVEKMEIEDGAGKEQSKTTNFRMTRSVKTSSNSTTAASNDAKLARRSSRSSSCDISRESADRFTYSIKEHLVDDAEAAKETVAKGIKEKENTTVDYEYQNFNSACEGGEKLDGRNKENQAPEGDAERQSRVEMKQDAVLADQIKLERKRDTFTTDQLSKHDKQQDVSLRYQHTNQEIEDVFLADQTKSQERKLYDPTKGQATNEQREQGNPNTDPTKAQEIKQGSVMRDPTNSVVTEPHSMKPSNSIRSHVPEAAFFCKQNRESEGKVTEKETDDNNGHMNCGSSRHTQGMNEPSGDRFMKEVLLPTESAVNGTSVTFEPPASCSLNMTEATTDITSHKDVASQPDLPDNAASMEAGDATETGGVTKVCQTRSNLANDRVSKVDLDRSSMGHMDVVLPTVNAVVAGGDAGMNPTVPARHADGWEASGKLFDAQRVQPANHIVKCEPTDTCVQTEAVVGEDPSFLPIKHIPAMNVSDAAPHLSAAHAAAMDSAVRTVPYLLPDTTHLYLPEQGVMKSKPVPKPTRGRRARKRSSSAMAISDMRLVHAPFSSHPRDLHLVQDPYLARHPHQCDPTFQEMSGMPGEYYDMGLGGEYVPEAVAQDMVVGADSPTHVCSRYPPGGWYPCPDDGYFKVPRTCCGKYKRVYPCPQTFLLAVVFFTLSMFNTLGLVFFFLVWFPYFRGDIQSYFYEC